MTETAASMQVPTHIPSLARLIDRMPAGPQDGPDLWDRLVAQEGDEEARRLWQAACSHHDAETAKDAAGVNAEPVQAVTARAIRRYVCEALRFNGDHEGATIAAHWASLIERGELPLGPMTLADLTP